MKTRFVLYAALALTGLLGCANRTAELLATREGMDASVRTFHRDSLRRLDADPTAAQTTKDASHLAVDTFDKIVAKSRAADTQPVQ